MYHCVYRGSGFSNIVAEEWNNDIVINKIPLRKSGSRNGSKISLWSGNFIFSFFFFLNDFRRNYNVIIGTITRVCATVAINFRRVNPS